MYIKQYLKNLKLVDYLTLSSLAVRVLWNQPAKYKRISLKDALGELSESGEKCY